MLKTSREYQAAETKMFKTVEKYRAKYGLFSLLRVLHRTLGEVDFIARR